MLNYSVLWAQKILHDVPAASGHIWEAQKRNIFSKMAKNEEKSLIFFSNNMHVKGAKTF